MSKLIYIADDEENIRSIMKIFLENAGYCVEAFSNGADIRQAVKNRIPDLVILDIMMPGEDGLSICSGLRKESNVPIIIVSAKDTPMDRIAGLSLGSDDYIVKPFLPLELTARVQALFRRIDYSAAPLPKPENTIYQCGNVLLDSQARQVSVSHTPIPITPTEYDFLRYLFERQSTAVSKKELLEHIWNYKNISDDIRVCDDLVKRLRKKFKERGASAILETVWGYGYRLTAAKQGEDL